jgi:hypothetical protein
LVWSILLYAISALCAGFTTSLPWLVFFRCTTFVGVCVEFVAAVAWLAELFPIPKQRESVLGYTQAFSSFGGRPMEKDREFYTRCSELLRHKGRSINTWDYEHLAAYLHDPKGAIPGNKMAFPGIKDNAELADVIVYLRKLSDNPAPLPQ